MIDYSETRIKQLVIHQVGSQAEGLNNVYSQCSFNLPSNDNPLLDLLKMYFLSSFKPDVLYCFEGSKQRSVYGAVDQIFNDSSLLFINSKEIADRLWALNSNAQAKTGAMMELYVVEFEQVKINDSLMNCLGIFVSEHRDTFLKVQAQQDNFSIEQDQGINIKKLDKGCLIYNIEAELGYAVSVVLNDKKKGSSALWLDELLELTPRQDQFFYTQNYLNICKDFVSKVYNDENEILKTDQIDLLNRSFNFFQNNKTFSEDQFAQQVISTPEVRDAFMEFKDQYQEEQQIPPLTKFTISNDAVKKQNRFFKSVIKLDKNFHVYVHGNSNFIEKGFDSSKGLHYYRLFFEAED